MDATELLFILGGSYIGARLGDKYLGNTGERPVWNGHIGNDPSMPAVAITVQKWRARLWYRLFIADQGDWAMVGISQVYAEILAMIQQWERYLTEGGTLNAWRIHCAKAAQETAGLEDSFNQPEADEPQPKPKPKARAYTTTGWVIHPDGTIDHEVPGDTDD